MINTNTVSTRREENSIISVRKMCVVALAIVLNVIGGQIALMLNELTAERAKTPREELVSFVNL